MQQPKPGGHGVPIMPLVIKDMEARMALGIERYGQPLKAWDGRDTLVDIYQELLDASVYVRKEIEERARAPSAEALELIRELLGAGFENIIPDTWFDRARALLAAEATRHRPAEPEAAQQLRQARSVWFFARISHHRAQGLTFPDALRAVAAEQGRDLDAEQEAMAAEIEKMTT